MRSRPCIFGAARIKFAETGSDRRDPGVTCASEITDGAVPVDWDNAEQTDVAASDLNQPVDGSLPIRRRRVQGEELRGVAEGFHGGYTARRTLDLFLASAPGPCRSPAKTSATSAFACTQHARKAR